MKTINDLMRELLELREKHGNLPVALFWDCDYDEFCKIPNLDVIDNYLEDIQELSNQQIVRIS